MISVHAQHLRLVEAILFASAEPVADATIAGHLPEDIDLEAIMGEVVEHYANRGINLVRVAGKWAFRTAEDLAPSLRVERESLRKLSRPAVETLAIVAYHQPVTRAEIEEIRGVSVSRGTLDVLMETGWVRPGRRRKSPGRPVTWVTTPAFLEHFGLVDVSDLPGLKELKLNGLLDTRPAISVYAASAAGDETILGPETEDDAEDETEADELPLEHGED